MTVATSYDLRRLDERSAPGGALVAVSAVFVACFVWRINSNELFDRYVPLFAEAGGVLKSFAFLVLAVVLFAAGTKSWRVPVMPMLVVLCATLVVSLGMMFGPEQSFRSAPARVGSYLFAWTAGYFLAINGAFGEGSGLGRAVRALATVVLLLIGLAYLELGTLGYQTMVADAFAQAGYDAAETTQFRIGNLMTGGFGQRFSWPGMDPSASAPTMFIALFCVTAIAARSRLEELYNAALIVVLLMLIGMTLTRGAIAVTAGFLATCLFFGVLSRPLLLASITGVAIAVILQGRFLLDRLLSAYYALTESYGVVWWIDESSDRLADIPGAFAAMMDAPFWGHGDISLIDRNAGAGMEIPTLGIEAGLLLMAVGVGLLLWPLLRSVSNLRTLRLPDNRATFVLAIGFGWLFVYVMMTSTTDATRHLVAGCVTGLIAWVVRRSQEGKATGS